MNNIIVEFSSGRLEVLPAATPVYVKSWADCHGAHAAADDGSMRSVDDLTYAGALGDPGCVVGGRSLDPKEPFTYHVVDGNANGTAEPIKIVG